jgi:hypothetical protein
LDEEPDNLWKTLLASKSKLWGYEEEWRIVVRLRGNNIFEKIPKEFSVVSGIVFGLSMPTKERANPGTSRRNSS